VEPAAVCTGAKTRKAGVGGLAVERLGALPGGGHPQLLAVVCCQKLVGLAGRAGFVDFRGPGGRGGVSRQNEDAAGAAVQAGHHVGFVIQMQSQPLDGAQFARLARVRSQARGFVHCEPVVVLIKDQGAPSLCLSEGIDDIFTS